jgi:cbb3-type cytochrome oxidase maturation protein
MDMLERLQKAAEWLRPLLPVAVVLGIAGVIVFLWAAAAGGGQDDGALILGLVATLWGALLFALITGFRQIPPPASNQQSLVLRIKAQLTRGAYVVMAWAMAGAAALSLLMTYRLLMLWLG